VSNLENTSENLEGGAMSEEQVMEAPVDTELELNEEEVQEEQVSPEVAAFRDELRSKPGDWFVVHLMLVMRSA